MDIASVFARIAEEIPGYLSAAVGELGSDRFDVHASGDLSLAEADTPLHAMVRSFADTYQALGGRLDLGSNDELLLTASRAYLLIKVDHEAGRFLAVLLSSSANIGFLRFQVRSYLRDLAR